MLLNKLLMSLVSGGYIQRLSLMLAVYCWLAFLCDLMSDSVLQSCPMPLMFGLYCEIRLPESLSCRFLYPFVCQSANTSSCYCCSKAADYLTLDNFVITFPELQSYLLFATILLQLFKSFRVIYSCQQFCCNCSKDVELSTLGNNFLVAISKLGSQNIPPFCILFVCYLLFMA